MVRPNAMMLASDPTITGLDPIRSSTSPPTTAPNAATMLAATPKISTSAGEIPYTLTPSTPPKVNRPASPSRNTAAASRKYTKLRSRRHSATSSVHSLR